MVRKIAPRRIPNRVREFLHDRSIAWLSRVTGLTREGLYNIIRGSDVKLSVAYRITKALTDSDDVRVVFPPEVDKPDDV